MSETTILYAGIVCLALVLLAMVLTVYEFRKFSRTEGKARTVDGPLAASKVAALRPSDFTSLSPKGVLHDQAPAPAP